MVEAIVSQLWADVNGYFELESPWVKGVNIFA